jgi:hypothetical protein
MLDRAFCADPFFPPYAESYLLIGTSDPHHVPARRATLRTDDLVDRDYLTAAAPLSDVQLMGFRSSAPPEIVLRHDTAHSTTSRSASTSSLIERLPTVFEPAGVVYCLIP